MRYTVKQLADVAGVSSRTLHYYDEIGLLPPTTIGENGYRYYDERAALRLQQILFYRELGMSLSDIKAVLDAPDFDVRQALEDHKRALRRQARRIDALLNTIDETLKQLNGEQAMDAETLFGGFDNEQEKQWSQEAIGQYGYDNSLVQESARRWRSLTAEDKVRLRAEGEAIYQAFADLVGSDPDSADVQAVVARWHAHLGYFYDLTPDLLAGLGQMYAANPDFRATFTALHSDLPAFLEAAIAAYVERLSAG